MKRLKISVEQLCADYYNSQVFNVDSESPFYIELMADLLKSDSSNNKINTDILFVEIPSITVELFGFSWFLHNYHLFQQQEQGESESESATISEIVFTKSYLEQSNNKDVWISAGFYNDTIFHSHKLQFAQRDWSVPRDTDYYIRDIPFSVKQHDLLETNIRDSYYKKLTDKDCAIRLANRLLSVSSWQNGILIPQNLSKVFSQRLKLSENIETILLIQRFVEGIYKNINHYFQSVLEFGSWELARKRANNIRSALFKIAQNELEKQKDKR